jgi:pectate lyase
MGNRNRTAKLINRRAALSSLLFLGLVFLSVEIQAQLPAFPGAEGFGALTTGGRGGSVIEVTNLNDSGAGSLRAAIQGSGPRTVVFRVSGTIELQSELRISSGNITIAGQTAPGDGICLSNFPLTVDASNVIIRFIRTRHGDLSGSQGDAMWGREKENIIIDHCSMSWSVDEAGSFYDNKNFTLQYCILSESLYASIHDKGNHGYGGIWGGQGATFHHNLLAHHTSRNPRFNGSRYTGQPELELVDYRNNVIYNWGFNSAYGGEAGNHNIMDNYYRSGPATSSNVRDRIIQPDANENGYGTYYISGNVTDGFPAVTADNWLGVDGLSPEIKDQVRLDAPLEAPALTPQTAYEAFEHVLAQAGAILPHRDAIDTRIVHETRTRTAQYGGLFGDGKGIIDSQETVGGWLTMESTTPPEDSDHDGMPDEWEDDRGLDKNDPADRNGDLNGNGYTNLEDYLNGLVEAFAYIPRPMHFRVDTIVDYAVTLSWADISDNETGFLIERKEGDSWAGLVTTAAGDTSYTDNSLSANGSYFYRLKAINDSLESFYTDSVAVQLTVGLEKYREQEAILEVYPNPLSTYSTLKYSLHQQSVVTISVHDLTGKEIMTLESGIRSPGEYTIPVRANELDSGVYLIRFKANDTVLMKKVLVLR